MMRRWYPIGGVDRVAESERRRKREWAKAAHRVDMIELRTGRPYHPPVHIVLPDDFMDNLTRDDLLGEPGMVWGVPHDA